MKHVEIFRSDNYSNLEDARNEMATYTAPVPDDTSIDTVREIVELCGITHNGDPAHFKAVLITTDYV